MDLIQITTFTVVALLLVVSPGPNGLLIAKTVPISGKGAGFSNIAGFVTAFYLHGTLSILGISVILTKSAEAFFIVKMLGAIYLIWIGLKALLSAFQNTESNRPEVSLKSKKTLYSSYLEGFLTNALNPKVSMFYLAAFPQFIPLGESAITYSFMLVSIHAFLNIIWFGLMVSLLLRLKSIASQSFFKKLLKSVTGIIFIGLGVKLVTLPAK